MGRLPVAVAAGLIVFTTACQREVVVIVREPGEVPPGAQVVHVPDEDPATIAEIDTVKKLPFPSNRTDALCRIARRDYLAPTAQVHIVDTAVEQLPFPSDRTNVWLTLVRNTYFANAAKLRILERLGDLPFPSDRENVMRAINNRGPLLY